MILRWSADDLGLPFVSDQRIITTPERLNVYMAARIVS